MEITQTATPSITPVAASDTQASGSTQISSDFETFLKMLTAQMQYQDPLNPVDSTDYATQLATFSGVEQAVLTNDLLATLTTQMNTSGLADMAGLVGKEARTAGPAYFDGQPIELLPKPAAVADKAEIIVRNEAGEEVQRMPVALGQETAVWAGVQADGTPMPAGLYSFDVVSTLNDEVISQTPIEVYSVVTEVRLEGAQTVLVLKGGATVPSDQVTALRDADV